MEPLAPLHAAKECSLYWRMVGVFQRKGVHQQREGEAEWEKHS